MNEKSRKERDGRPAAPRRDSRQVRSRRYLRARSASARLRCKTLRPSISPLSLHIMRVYKDHDHYGAATAADSFAFLAPPFDPPPPPPPTTPAAPPMLLGVRTSHNGAAATAAPAALCRFTITPPSIVDRSHRAIRSLGKVRKSWIRKGTPRGRRIGPLVHGGRRAVHPKGEEAEAKQETCGGRRDRRMACQLRVRIRVRRSPHATAILHSQPLTPTAAHAPMIHLSRAAPCRSGRLNGLFWM